MPPLKTFSADELERAPGGQGPRQGGVRTPEETERFFTELRALPDDEWALWSYHRTLSSARGRPFKMRSTKKFSGLPIEWRAAPLPEPVEGYSAALLVRWVGDPDEPVKSFRKLKVNPAHSTYVFSTRSSMALDIKAMRADGEFEKFIDALTEADEKEQPLPLPGRYLTRAEMSHQPLQRPVEKFDYDESGPLTDEDRRLAEIDRKTYESLGLDPDNPYAD